MERYVLIKSERSLRQHKAAGARFQYAPIAWLLPLEGVGWQNDSEPYDTLRNPLFKEVLKLRAVYEEPAE